jgi:hypothetical protein
MVHRGTDGMLYAGCHLSAEGGEVLFDRFSVIHHWDFVIDSSFWFLNSSLLSLGGSHRVFEVDGS